MKPGLDGRLYAINPEAGYFGVVPGTNEQTNPNAMRTIASDTIFTNVALLPGRRRLVGGQGRPRRPRSASTGRASPGRRLEGEGGASQQPLHRAHDQQPEPRARGRRPARRAHQRHHLRRPARHDHAAGVPGVQLGARRLCRRHDGLRDDRRRGRRRWARCAATRWPCCPSAATTWATTSATGSPCGGRSRTRRASSTSTGSARTSKGDFLWPGFGENMRVLKWIVDRCNGPAGAQETPCGWVPRREDIDLDGPSRASPTNGGTS